MPGVGAMGGQNLGRIFFEMSIVDNGRFNNVLRQAHERLDAVNAKLGITSSSSENVVRSQGAIAKELEATNAKLALAEKAHKSLSDSVKLSAKESDAAWAHSTANLKVEIKKQKDMLAQLQLRYDAMNANKQASLSGVVLAGQIGKTINNKNYAEERLALLGPNSPGVSAVDAERIEQADAKVQQLRSSQSALQAEMAASVVAAGVEAAETVDVVGNQIVAAGIKLDMLSMKAQSFGRTFMFQWSLVAGVITGFIEKMAIDFDKNMGEVRRTTQMTRDEISGLGDDFLRMSKDSPMANAANGLAEIAAVAGASGVKGRDELGKFSDSILRLTAVSDGLDEKETAKKMIEITRAFGDSTDKIDRYGDVISRVANESSASYEDVINFIQISSGAAQALHISFGEVASLGSALVGLGIPAQKAGTALTNLFTKMLTEPQVFAAQMGISTAKFEQSVKDNAVGALISWLETMKNVHDEFELGKDFDELGIKGVRTGAVLLKLKSEGLEPLQRMLGIVQDTMTNGGYVTDQYNVKAQTMSGQMSEAANQGKELAIRMGSDLFPVLKTFLTIFEEIFAALREAGPLKDIVLAMAMMTTLAGPLALVFGNLGRFVSGWIVKIGEARIAVAAYNAQQIEMGYTSVAVGGQVKTAMASIGTANLWIAGIVVAMIALTSVMAMYSEANYKAKERQEALNDELKTTLQHRRDEKEQVVQILESMKPLAEKQQRSKEEQAQFNKYADNLNRLAPDYIDKNKLYGDSLKYIADKAIEAKKGLNDASEAVAELDRRTQIGKLNTQMPLTQADMSAAFDAIKAEQLNRSTFSPAVESVRSQTGFYGEVNTAGTQAAKGKLDSAHTLLDDQWQKLHALQLQLEDQHAKDPANQLVANELDRVKSDLDTVEKLDALVVKHNQEWQQKWQLDHPASASGNANSSGSGSGTTRVTLKDLQEEFDAQKVLNDGIRQAIKDKQDAVAAEGDKTTAKEKKNELQTYYDSIAGTIDERNAAMDAILAKVRAFAAREYGNTKTIDELTKNIINNKNKALTSTSIAILGFIHDVDGSRIHDPSAHINAPPDESAFNRLKTQLQLYQSLLDDFNAKYRTKKDEATDKGLLSDFLIGDGVKMKQDILDMKAAVIKTLQDIIAELVKDSPEAAALWSKINGTTDAKGYEKFAQAILSSTSLTGEQQKEIALALAQLSKAQGVIPNDNASKKDQNPYKVFAENVNQMGLTNRNTLNNMQQGWNRLNSAIVGMAFGTKTTLKQIWQGIAQDFLKDVLDEIYKKYLAKGLVGLVGTLFGDSSGMTKIGTDILSGGGDDSTLHGDFMVRKNGSITSFSPDDNVIGFKHVTDLIGSILPSVASSNFSTMPSSNISVGSPSVRVDSKPPDVHVHIDHVMDGQKFQQKTVPRYNYSTAGRKLRNG